MKRYVMSFSLLGLASVFACAGGATNNAASSNTGSTSDKVLSSGDAFAIAYVARGNTPQSIGIDTRPSVAATFDSNGKLTGYNASDNERLDLGGATATKAGGDDIATAGTWSGGPTTGKFYNAHPTGEITFDADHGIFHFGICKPTLTSALAATGTATYVLAHATAPTSSADASEGATSEVSLVADFSAKTVSVSVAASVGGASGGDISANALTGTISGTSSAGFYASGTQYSVRGFLCGDDASQAVLVFESTGTIKGAGAVVLKKQ